MIKYYHVGGQLYAYFPNRDTGLRSVWFVSWGAIAIELGWRERPLVPDDIQ